MSSAAAEVVDRHIDAQQRLAAEIQETTRRAGVRAILDTPPRDAAVTAALLTAAHQIISLPTEDQLKEYVRALAPVGAHARHRSLWSYLLYDRDVFVAPSKAFHRACMPVLLDTIRVGDRIRPRARRYNANPVTTARLEARHVPALLPAHWLDRHVQSPPEVSASIFYRTAALRVVSLLTGRSLMDSGTFLGIGVTNGSTQTLVYYASAAVHRWERSRPEASPFENVLRTLIGELDSLADLVDYQHRRAVLKKWVLDQKAWRTLTADLPQLQELSPDHEGRMRQEASAYLWTVLTRGEQQFAPRPLEVAQPLDVQSRWKLNRHTVWTCPKNTGSTSVHSSMIGILDQYAVDLAHRIDQNILP